MSKQEKKKRDHKKKEKEYKKERRPRREFARSDERNFDPVSAKEGFSVKNYAKKFYQIMRDAPAQKYVNCEYIHEKFNESGWSLNDDPHKLWRTWRQCEADFPMSIDFLPQILPIYRPRPSGWRFVGPPQYGQKKRLK